MTNFFPEAPTRIRLNHVSPCSRAKGFFYQIDRVVLAEEEHFGLGAISAIRLAASIPGRLISIKIKSGCSSSAF